MNSLLKGLGAAPQFILFCALTLTCIGLGTILAVGVGTYVFGIPLEELPTVLADPEPHYATALIWMNNVTQIVGFALPVGLFLLLFGGGNIQQLLLKPGNIIVLISPIIILSAAPLIDLSAWANQLMITEGSWLEKAFKPTEELAERMTRMFLEPGSGIPPFVAFFSIAIIPAVCEELVFRGVIMPLLGKMTRNIHASVWITAALFSLIHVQFYGFLPRLLMGALLGYMVVWSGSLWGSIVAHFINNASAFILFQYYGTMETPDGSFMSHWIFYAAASVLFVVLIRWCIKQSAWPRMSFQYLGMSDLIGKRPGE